jgi:hypothetical protein
MPEKARAQLCCVDLNRQCEAYRCMAWEFYDPPVELLKGKLTHGKAGHGLRSDEKLGYCGLSKRRS